MAVIKPDVRIFEIRHAAYVELPMKFSEDAIIHVVDDDLGVRESLRFLLELEGWRIETYADAASLLATSLPTAGCILTDFQMPETNGLQLQALLAGTGVCLPVIVMTGCGDIPLAVRAMKAGALDFLEKPFEDDALLDAVRKALEYNRKHWAQLRAAEEASARIALLTPREFEVMPLVAAGKATKEIALILGTSPRTIDVHRARVLQKLQVDTLPDLIRVIAAARPISIT
jgi:two-component system response regulator FixJ